MYLFGCEKSFQPGNVHFGTVKHAGSQRTVNRREFKYIRKMLHRASATGCDQRHIAQTPHSLQLINIVALPNTILVHAVQNYFSGAALLHFGDPGVRGPQGCGRFLNIAGQLVDPVVAVFLAAIDSDDNTLRAESRCQFIDQLRSRQCR